MKSAEKNENAEFESVELLKKYLQSATPEQLREDWAYVESLNLEGPTSQEVLEWCGPDISYFELETFDKFRAAEVNTNQKKASYQEAFFVNGSLEISIHLPHEIA